MRNKTMKKTLIKVYTPIKAFLAVFICLAFLTGCGNAESLKSDGQEVPDDIKSYENLTPTPEITDPAAGQSLEGNITAYGELKPAVKAVLEYIAKEPGSPYGIVAYQQTEFDGGTLVLAEGLMDGEIYPELYFVDKENVIRSCTIGSRCWEFNFTEFSDKRIYYGYIGGPAAEVVLRYDGTSASAVPHSPGAIAVKNETEDTESFIKNRQGYILVTDRKDMPASFEIKKEEGEIVNYSEEMLQSTPIPPYANVEEQSIRCASLYQYNRMTELGGAGAAEGIGWVCLQYGEDMQQLEPAGRFKWASLQELSKPLSVYALCWNYINESQYLPAGGKIKLVSEKGFPKDTKIRCYFSRLTKGTWDIYKEPGSLSFLRTFREPDSDGNIELLDEKGYHFMVVCVNDSSTSGTSTYVCVINLTEGRQ